jgi:hypothetical protein
MNDDDDDTTMSIEITLMMMMGMIKMTMTMIMVVMMMIIDHLSKIELLFLLRISMCPKQPFSSTDHIFWVDDISYNIYNYEQLQTMSIMMMMMA